MEPVDIEKIKNNLVELKSDLIPLHILDQLVQDGTIHLIQDFPRIEREITTGDQTQKLVDILYTKHGAYPSFHKSLMDNGFQHLAAPMGPPEVSGSGIIYPQEYFAKCLEVYGFHVNVMHT